jgi:hypothetical protein
MNYKIVLKTVHTPPSPSESHLLIKFVFTSLIKYKNFLNPFQSNLVQSKTFYILHIYENIAFIDYEQEVIIKKI